VLAKPLNCLAIPSQSVPEYTTIESPCKTGNAMVFPVSVAHFPLNPFVSDNARQPQIPCRRFRVVNSKPSRPASSHPTHAPAPLPWRTQRAVHKRHAAIPPGNVTTKADVIRERPPRSDPSGPASPICSSARRRTHSPMSPRSARCRIPLQHCSEPLTLRHADSPLPSDAMHSIPTPSNP
jgi:hypothetical protein